jgi:hypothetical protein
MRLIIAVLLPSALAFADSGAAKNDGGFCIGFGVGPSMTSYTQELKPSSGKSIDVNRRNSIGMATDFYIGGGVSPTTYIMGYIKINWFNFSNQYQSYFAANSNTGIQLLKYFNDDIKQVPFMLVGFGWSGLTDMSRRNESTTPGIAPTIGFGYKMAEHYGVQSNLFYSNPSPLNTENGYNVNVDALSVQLNWFAQI